MLQPKKTKYRKAFKGKIHGNAKGSTTLNFGSYGLKAMEPERITARQIEAARRAITRHIKRQGRLWIRVFPDVPVSKKPAEVRQGKGKGSIEYWAARVKPGRILFELDGVAGPTPIPSTVALTTRNVSVPPTLKAIPTADRARQSWLTRIAPYRTTKPPQSSDEPIAPMNMIDA